MGLCVFAAPEIAVGAVIVMGAVVVAAAITEGLEAYERSASRERAKPKTQARPAKEPLANRTPEPEGSRSGDIFPPLPTRYPGMDVFVNGERFDALQVGVRVLWEIKTHRFDTYNAYVQRQEIEKELNFPDPARDAELLSRSRRTASGGWVVQLTDAPLELDSPAHLDALKRAYERFPEIGGRAAP